jgi:cysteine desulfurase
MSSYFDNSAATRLDERVLEAMTPYFFDIYSVATSEFGYSLGIEAKEALEAARKSIAGVLGAQAEEFIFTSGATESSNMAIKGIASGPESKKGQHIITSKIEDFPVLNSVKALERQGFKATYLSAGKDGLIDLNELSQAITDKTILVSVQHANQEIGTIQDIEAIARLCRQKHVLFHTDATHTFTRVHLDVRDAPADMITVSAHTIHGPKGVGGLYVRKGTPFAKWMDGGFQEFNLRAGLEDIPGAVGFAKAVELVRPEENANIIKLRNHLINRMLAEIPDASLNGHKINRLPQNANITFHYVEGESITLHLDMRGFAVSTGSACFSRSLEASHVIMGIGGDHEQAHGSIRFSFGRFNTKQEVDRLVDVLAEVVSDLRKISPLGKNNLQEVKE